MTIRRMSDDDSPADSSKLAPPTSADEWISAARKEMTKLRTALNGLDNVIAQIETKQATEENEFRNLMRRCELSEPKPEDEGLPRGWTPDPKKYPEFYEMGRWRG